MIRFFKRLADWSHWPFGVFYLPLFIPWLYYCFRSGSPWFFAPSNSTIPFGGFEGESKMQIYTQLSQDLYPRTVCVEPGLATADLLLLIEGQGLHVPFVVKPDAGMEGLLFEKIEHLQELFEYHARVPVPYLVQEYVDLPVEASVFYHRFPGKARGVISGFIQKHLGPSGIGNRPQGAVFTDLSGRITDALQKTFDRISLDTSFLYGRYDLKCSSVTDLASGKGFMLLEFNGAGAIPNHVFAGSHTLLQAYGEIMRHWGVLYRISRAQVKRGAAYPGLAEGWRYLRAAKRHFRMLRRLAKAQNANRF